MIVHYLKTNLKELRGNRKQLLLIILSQAVCIICMLFAYGVVVDYKLSSYEKTGGMNYVIYLEDVEGKEFFPALDEILCLIERKVSGVELTGSEFSDGHYLSAYFEYENGEYLCSEAFRKNIEGRGLTQEDFDSERFVACVGEVLAPQTTITFGDDTYEIVGYQQISERAEKYYSEFGYAAEVPYQTLKNRKLNYCSVEMSLVLSERQAEQIRAILNHSVPGKYEFDSQPYEKGELDNASRTGLYAAVVIGILSAVNTCAMYRLILNKRTRLIQIFRLCGMKKRTVRLLFLGEIFTVSAVITILCGVIYAFGLVKLLSKWYLYFPDIFYAPIYLLLTAVYLSVSMLVSILFLWYPIHKIKMTDL